MPPTILAQVDLTSPPPSLSQDGEDRLAFFNVHAAVVQPDRRLARRYLVDCPARFAISGGERHGRLSDLSEHGARLETVQPPPPGTSGFLRWNGEDHYCKVIWSNDARCGLQFERPIALALIEATCSQVEVTLKPIAAVDRIPLGQKRSRPFIAYPVAET